MTDYVPVAGVAQANIQYLQNGSIMENTLYFKGAVPWTPALLTALANSIWDHWATDVMIDLTPSLEITGVRCVDLTTQTGPVGQHIEHSTGSSVYNQPLAQGSAFCLKFITANRGRSFRGRVYLPGLATGMMSGVGELSSAHANTLLEDVKGAIAAVAADQAVTHEVVSRYSGKLPNGKPAPRAVGISTPVTDVLYSDVHVDSQRRRLLGRGA